MAGSAITGLALVQARGGVALGTAAAILIAGCSDKAEPCSLGKRHHSPTGGASGRLHRPALPEGYLQPFPHVIPLSFLRFFIRSAVVAIYSMG